MQSTMLLTTFALITYFLEIIMPDVSSEMFIIDYWV